MVLHLVARLVEHYCGTVELVETGPEGSTFRITLPREPPEESTPSPFVDPFRDPAVERQTRDAGQ